MERNTIIIIALIAVILALLAGIGFMTADMDKHDTKLIFTSNDTIDEGDYIKIKLTDVNGTELENQTVNITITDEDNSNSYYSVVTDDEGNGKVKVDKDAGNYTVTLSYGGNDDYSESQANCYLTVEKVASTSSDDESTAVEYPYHSSKIGNYRLLENQGELGVIETSNGQLYVLAGDGLHTYEGHDSNGNIKSGGPIG